MSRYLQIDSIEHKLRNLRDLATASLANKNQRLILHQHIQPLILLLPKVEASHNSALKSTHSPSLPMTAPLVTSPLQCLLLLSSENTSKMHQAQTSAHRHTQLNTNLAATPHLPILPSHRVTERQGSSNDQQHANFHPYVSHTKASHEHGLPMPSPMHPALKPIGSGDRNTNRTSTGPFRLSSTISLLVTSSGWPPVQSLKPSHHCWTCSPSLLQNKPSISDSMSCSHLREFSTYLVLC